MKNKDKYDQYYEIFKAEEEKYLKGLFPDGLPSKMYQLGRTTIEEKIVTGTCISVKGIYGSGKNITNKEVEHIKAYVEKGISFSPSDVMINYEYYYATSSKVIGSESYEKVLANERFTFDRSLLEEALQRNIEFYTLKEGDISCAYCGRATPATTAVKDYVIARQYPNGRKQFEYCSGECATHNQMSHEG